MWAGARTVLAVGGRGEDGGAGVAGRVPSGQCCRPALAWRDAGAWLLLRTCTGCLWSTTSEAGCAVFVLLS